MSRVVESIAPARLGRSFRWLLASSWVSNIGDGIGLAAGPLLVASQTHDPLLVALATLLQRLPWLLFGLHAGVVADRLAGPPIGAALFAVGMGWPFVTHGILVGFGALLVSRIATSKPDAPTIRTAARRQIPTACAGCGGTLRCAR